MKKFEVPEAKLDESNYHLLNNLIIIDNNNNNNNNNYNDFDKLDNNINNNNENSEMNININEE